MGLEFAKSADEDDDFPPMPARYITAEQGNVASAQRRWRKTIRWRRQEGIDKLFQTIQPHFKLIKDNFPHYYHEYDRLGRFIYIERPGLLNLKVLEVPMLLQHYMLLSEYAWRVIDPRPDGKSLTIVDVKGIGIKDCGGKVMEFIKKAAHIGSEYYPERLGVYFIINAPSWFGFIWKMVKPLVPKETREKIFIYSYAKEYKPALLKFVHPEVLPEEYGGAGKIPLGKSRQEIFLARVDDDATAENTAFANDAKVFYGRGGRERAAVPPG